jgi:FKBP-type peptidyl-prolyl cis-trans isomerase SlyD
MTNSVADNMVVSIEYTLRLDDGQVIDTSEGRDPLTFLQGRGAIISGLEQELYGMTVGEEKQVVVQPAQGYGEPDPDDFQRFPREMFPADLELEDGMGLRLIESDTGRPIEAYVAEVGEEDVLLDFNHPLAGETLFFDVKIADVRQATSEEVSHGHAH